MVNQVVKETEKLAPEVETLFHWREEDDSHCLLRIYVDNADNSATVVTSKLHSETPGENHLSADFEQLALAIYKKYQYLLKNLRAVTWIAHYGVFSVADSYENATTTEEFSQVNLPWPLPNHLSSFDGKWKGLDPEEEEQLTNQLTLEPVADILSRIDSGR